MSNNGSTLTTRITATSSTGIDFVCANVSLGIQSTATDFNGLSDHPGLLIALAVTINPSSDKPYLTRIIAIWIVSVQIILCL